MIVGGESSGDQPQIVVIIPHREGQAVEHNRRIGYCYQKYQDIQGDRKKMDFHQF